MRLAINVGNTNVQFGYLEGGDLRVEKFPVGAPLPTVDFEGIAWMASVNPAGAAPIVASLGDRVRSLTWDDVPGLSLNYDRPHQLGADRVANLLGLRMRWAGKPLLAIDAGTATTFEALLSPERAFAGPILPGPGLMQKALTGTAQLPSVAEREYGIAEIRSSEDAIASGIGLAHLGAVEKVVQEFLHAWGEMDLVVCGGVGPSLAPKLREKGLDTEEDPALTLRGLLSLPA